MVDLKLAFCSHEAAKFACEHWHYSGCMPTAKTVKIGVWENGEYIGVVIYSCGASPQSHMPFSLKREQVCELTRVALKAHMSSVSRIVAISLRMLKKQSPGLKLVISFADPEQDHHGGIYQAGNWIYLGKTGLCEHFVNATTGKRIYSKSLKSGKPGLATKLLAVGKIKSIKVWKYKYVMPLSPDVSQSVKLLKKEYPKRRKHL